MRFDPGGGRCDAAGLAVDFDVVQSEHGVDRGHGELTFTLSGGEGTFSDAQISAWFPTGLNVAASSSSQCGGTLTTTPAPDVTPLPKGGATEVSLSVATLAAGGSCSFSVPVTAESAGQLTVGTSFSASRATNDGAQGYG